MGPRFANRGYRPPAATRAAPSPPAFNGSTVREPWLSWNSSALALHLYNLQWVHGSRTVVIHCGNQSSALPATAPSMGPRFANRGYLEIVPRCPVVQDPSMGPRF